MKKARKALLTLCAALLLVTMTAGVTIAYLTDNTGAVKNTFTVGKVDIKLDEAEIKDGVATGERLTASSTADVGNTYKLFPNGSYTKDPTITVEDGSEDCYVMAKVTVSTPKDLAEIIPNGEDTGLIAFGGIVNGGVFSDSGMEQKPYENYGGGTVADDLVYESDNYKLVQTAANDVNERYFYVFVKKPMTTTTNNEVVLFENITIPSDWKENEMSYVNGLNIKVEAFAAQKDGFDNVEDAIKAAFPNVYPQDAQ